MSVSQVFSFPDTVDEHAARLVASGVVVMSLAIVLGGQRWVLIPLAAGSWPGSPRGRASARSRWP